MPTKPFENQVSIVSGAGQGIGFEICRQLSEAGSIVVLNDIDEQLTEKAVEKINNESGNCHAFSGDVSDPLFIRKMVGDTAKKFGKVNIGIANAGITLFGSFLEYSAEDFYKVLHTNMGSSFFLAQACAAQMKSQQTGGSILFMSSATGHQAHKDLAAYSMTKAGIEMLAKNLVIELSEYRINVNALAPGATMNERTAEDKDYLKTWTRLTPMGRPAYPKDIAEAALFLVSEKARHITGQTIIIDGGWSSISPSPF
jgi:glucose 1-dehydrogenase